VFPSALCQLIFIATERYVQPQCIFVLTAYKGGKEYSGKYLGRGEGVKPGWRCGRDINMRIFLIRSLITLQGI